MARNRTNPNRTARPQNQPALVLALAPVPALGFYFNSGAAQDLTAGQDFIGLFILAVLFHSMLLLFLPSRRESEGVRALSASALAISLLLLGPEVARELLPANPLALLDPPNPWAVVPAWLGGAALGALSLRLVRGGPLVGDTALNIKQKCLSLLRMTIVLIVGFTLAFALGRLAGGGRPGIDTAGMAVLATLASLSVLALTRAALAHFSPGQRQMTAVLVVLIVVTGFVLLPAIPPGRAGHSLQLMLLVGLGLASVASRQPVAVLATALLIAAKSQDFILSPMPAALVEGLALAIIPLGLLLRDLVSLQDRTLSSRALPAGMLSELQERTGLWIVHLDFQAKFARFPVGGGDQFGAPGDIPLNEFFRTADMAGVLELMERLQRGEAPSGAMVRLRLRPRSRPNDEAQEWVRQLFTVHVLKNHYPQCWLALASKSEMADISARQHQIERIIGEAARREDHLYRIAAHDLGPPIAMMEQMIEELEGGGSWHEIGPSLRMSLRQIAASVAELAPGLAPSNDRPVTGQFTPREVLTALDITFRGEAARNGIEMRVELSQQADMPLRGDHGRVRVALARLIQNAIQHSHGTELVVSAFVTRTTSENVVVTWHVSDNGTGIDTAQVEAVFQPLAAATGERDNPNGLGLFTARQSIRRIGGELQLGTGGQGSQFVLTHPARNEAPLRRSSYDPALERRMLHEDRAALLIDSDRIKGEILVAQLERLFGKVIWKRSTADGLAALKSGAPDMVLLSNRIEDLSQLDLLRKLRGIDPTVPIVAAAPSNRMTDRAELEEAGADHVLALPIGFAQLRAHCVGLFGMPEDQDGPQQRTSLA